MATRRDVCEKVYLRGAIVCWLPGSRGYEGVGFLVDTGECRTTSLFLVENFISTLIQFSTITEYIENTNLRQVRFYIVILTSAFV